MIRTALLCIALCLPANGAHAAPRLLFRSEVVEEVPWYPTTGDPYGIQPESALGSRGIGVAFVQNMAVQVLNLSDHVLSGRLEIGYAGGSWTSLPLQVMVDSTTRLVVPYVKLKPDEWRRLDLRLVDAAGNVAKQVHVPNSARGAAVVVDLTEQADLQTVLRSAGRQSGAGRVIISSPDKLQPRALSETLPADPTGYASAILVIASMVRIKQLSSVRLGALTDWVVSGGTLALTLQPGDKGISTVEGLFDGASHAPHLLPSRWGTSTRAGLGEVQILGVNLDSVKILEDEPTRWEVRALIQHAAARRLGSVVMPLGLVDPDHVASVLGEDGSGPIERNALMASCVLLLAYAITPLAFFRWRAPPKLGRLGGAIVAMALSFVFFIVHRVKHGGPGQSERLSFVEASAGRSRASFTSFRALFPTRAEKLTLAASVPRSVMALSQASANASSILMLDDPLRPRLEVNVRPQEILRVTEFGMTELGGGVELTNSEHLTVTNRSGFDLIAAVVHAPGAGGAFFPIIRNGARVSMSEGVQLADVRFRMPTTVGPAVSGLALPLRKAWEGVQKIARSGAPWWPNDAPVLIAELRGFGVATHDGGLPTKDQRTLVRVVGARATDGREP